MQVEVDKFGRFIIPKSVRLHLGIKPGAILELKEQDHKILLCLVDFQSALTRKEGVLVFTGEATDNLEDAIHSMREDRLEGLMKQ